MDTKILIKTEIIFTFSFLPLQHKNKNQYDYKFKFADIFLLITVGRLLWISYLKFISIFICNPSIANPGPDPSPKLSSSSSLSVYYQNVQGLTPFSNLAENHPILDSNKIFELHTYIHKHSPDIIILNETWLKPSILDTEIFPSDKYEIFRLDRSEKTHPIDALNTKKYRQNGGGVLIAISVSLAIDSKIIPAICAAELLAIELTLPNKTKIILTTCYQGRHARNVELF